MNRDRNRSRNINKNVNNNINKSTKKFFRIVYYILALVSFLVITQAARKNNVAVVLVTAVCFLQATRQRKNFF